MPNTEEERIGLPHAPAPHQRAIKDIMAMIDSAIQDDEFLVLPETPLGENPDDKIPDIVVIDEEQDLVMMTIEIELQHRTKACIKKMQRYMEYEDIQESFLFVYEPLDKYGYVITNIYRVTQDGYEEDTFSTVLDMDFEDLMETE